MIKQLAPNKPEPDSPIVASFTKSALIEYTFAIQERMMNAVEEAIKSSGVDMEYYVELDLHEREITPTVDDDSIYNEIVGNVKDVFVIDDDDIFDEACNVITHMKKF